MQAQIDEQYRSRTRASSERALKLASSTRALKLATLALLLLGTGCASGIRAEIADVATLDLGCEEVDVSEVGDDRYAAYGCGRGAVYAQVCDYDGCRWGRLRHGHEQNIAAGMVPPSSGREILPAPAPEPRVVMPAPYPEGAVVPPPAPSPQAPPPDSSNAPLQDSTLAPGAAYADPALAPVPLSQGDLSDPYQAEVPPQPIAQTVLYPPPAPLVEVRPVAPVRSYVWIGGYWWWGPANWVWVPGYWCPPYAGYAYVPGRWYYGAGHWHYGPGGWARPGTTVIVHNHVPPRPSTTVTVRAFAPHRVVSVGGAPGGRSVPSTRVVSTSSYRPSASPLYPSSSNKNVGRVAPAGGYRYEGGRPASAPSAFQSSARYGGTGVGRVVTPNTAVRTPSGYDARRASPTNTYRSPGGDSRAGGHSFDSGRSYGAGSSHSSSSGGGRSGNVGSHNVWGGGGGGGRGAAPVRVSPGGGGGGGGGKRGGR